MRTILALAILALVGFGCTSETSTPAAGSDAKSTGAVAAAAAPNAEVGCAMCSYKQAGATSCAAAVKVGDKVMLLATPGLVDLHKEQICDKGPRKATITGGKEEGGKYVATKIELAK